MKTALHDGQVVDVSENTKAKPVQPSGLNYSEIIEQIEIAPMTYLGGILIAAAKECRRKNFFRDNEALLRTIQNAIEVEDKSERLE